MKLSIIQSLATVTALAYGSPLTEVNSVPEGFELVPAKWTGEVVPGQGPITLEGCVESLREQILKINPDYFKNQDSTSAPSALAARQIGGCGGRAISKNIQCGVPYGTVHGSDISSGLVYLSNIGGCMTLGGNQCSRVSCSYNSGIFACNDVSSNYAHGKHIYILRSRDSLLLTLAASLELRHGPGTFQPHLRHWR